MRWPRQDWATVSEPRLPGGPWPTQSIPGPLGPSGDPHKDQNVPGGTTPPGIPESLSPAPSKTELGDDDLSGVSLFSAEG